MTKKYYDKLEVIPKFKQRFKQESIERGFPTMIAFQKSLLEKDDPLRDVMFKAKLKRKNDFII